MAYLLPAAFATKWTRLFADNVFQDIDGPRLAEFVADVRDSFATNVGDVNVPDWKEGTYYQFGFVILYSVTNTFYSALEAGYLVAPDGSGGEVVWEPTLSPASAGALYQVGTVTALQAARGSWVPGRLYVLRNRTDPADGAALDDVYVRALSAVQLEPTGFTIRNDALSAEPVPVSYDLVSDVTGDVAGPGYSKEEADNLLSFKAPLASPRFTGIPQAPTLSTVNNSDQLATTRFVQNLLALSYTNAYPFVCVRASDTSLSIAQFTLDNAIKWANLGGPGSVVYVNRPCTLGDIAVLAAGVILDLQHNPLDLAGSVIRLGNKAEIRNNRLMFSGRLAPDYGDGTPFSFTVRGGTLAGRLNYLVNNEATCILDDVVVADFGQQLLGGLNVGPATSDQVGPKVVLRNGAYFSVAYPPHPNTVVTTEAPPVYALADTTVLLDYVSSLVLDLNKASVQLLHLGGSLAVTATANRVQGRNVQLHLHNAAGNDVGLSWPAGWSWRGPAGAPASLAAGRQATLSLACVWGGTESDIVAGYASEA